MNGFVKLYGTILESTVWVGTDSAVKLVWITMLLKADPLGCVMASVPGLAKVAEIPVEEAERAIAVLEAPDPFSRTKDFDGRRIEKVEGGWRLLNYEKYREMRTPEQIRAAERQRKSREKRGLVGRRDMSQTSRDVTACHNMSQDEAGNSLTGNDLAEDVAQVSGVEDFSPRFPGSSPSHSPSSSPPIPSVFLDGSSSSSEERTTEGGSGDQLPLLVRNEEGDPPTESAEVTSFESRMVEKGVDLRREYREDFEVWRKTLSRAGAARAKRTDQRWRKYRARREEGGVTLEGQQRVRQEIREALQGWKYDPWEGREDHNGFEVLLRDRGKVELFSRLFRNNAPKSKQAEEVARPDGFVHFVSGYRWSALAGDWVPPEEWVPADPKQAGATGQKRPSEASKAATPHPPLAGE